MAFIGPDGEYLPEVGDGAEIYSEKYRIRCSAKPRGPAEGWDGLLDELLKREKQVVAPRVPKEKVISFS